MLSVARVHPGGDAYYFRTVAATTDRPDGLVEPDPYWLGGGAAALDLAGVAGRAQVRALFAGADPHSGELLAKRATARSRNAAYDVMLSTPKSVSIVHALADPGATERIAAAHARAVAATVSYLEREVLSALRSDRKGRWDVGVDGAIAAAFPHRTSRANDPHLHTHVLVANLALGDDGRWTALDSRRLYRAQRPARALFEAVLRHELTELGIELGSIRRDFAEIASITPEMTREFSRQSRLIAETMSEEGVNAPRASSLVAELVRPEKDRSRPYEELREEWRERAFAVGLSATRLATASGRDGTEAPATRRPLAPEARAAGELSWMESVATRPDGTFSRSELTIAFCASRSHGASAEEASRAVASAIGHPEVVPAGQPGRFVTRARQAEVAEAAKGLGALGGVTGASVIAYRGRVRREDAYRQAAEIAPPDLASRVIALAPGVHAARLFQGATGISTLPVKSLGQLAGQVERGDVIVLAEAPAWVEGELTTALRLCAERGASPVLFGSEHSMRTSGLLTALWRESPRLTPAERDHARAKRGPESAQRTGGRRRLLDELMEARGRTRSGEREHERHHEHDRGGLGR